MAAMVDVADMDALRAKLALMETQLLQRDVQIADLRRKQKKDEPDNVEPRELAEQLRSEYAGTLNRALVAEEGIVKHTEFMAHLERGLLELGASRGQPSERDAAHVA